MTGDKRANLYSKKRLGLTTLRDKILEAAYGYVRDLAETVWGRSGWFAAVGITSGPGTRITITPASSGMTSDGRILDLAALPAADLANIPVEGAAGEVYHVGFVFADVPSGVEVNPRTGRPYYSDNEETIGTLGTPDAVVDNGDGTLTLTVDTILDPGGAPRDCAGRKIRVWMVADPIAGLPASAVETIAFEEQTVVWTGTHNTIRTTALFGQTTASTTAAKYAVLARGPLVSRNTDLRTESSVVYVGNVTGDGAGNPPITIDTTDQRILFEGVLGYLSEIMAVDNNGHAKILVKGFPEDLVSTLYQLLVEGFGGTWIFRVFTDGTVGIRDAVGTGASLSIIPGATKMIFDLLAGSAIDFAGSFKPDVEIGRNLVALTSRLTFKDIFAPLGIDLTQGVWDSAIDPVLPASIVGAINRQVEYKNAIDGMIGDSVVGGATCSDGGGLDLDIGSGNFLIDGRYWSVGSATIALPDASTSYVYLRGVDQTYRRSATLPIPVSCVLVAKVTTVAGAITDIADLRLKANSLHTHGPILVGSAGAHFTNVWSAVRAIGEWYAPSAGTGAGRSWEILVVGTTVEPDTIVMPCDGISIRGVPGAGKITWDFEDPLFDLNGKRDLRFDNLKVEAIHAAAAAAQTRVVWSGSTARSTYNLRIENVEVTRAKHAVAGLMDVEDTLYDCVIRNLVAWNVLDFGINLAYVNNLTIDGIRIKRQGAHSGGPLADLIWIRGIGAVIRGGKIDGSEGAGIRLGEAGGTVCVQTFLDGVQVVASGSHAINFESNAAFCKATGCYFEGGTDGSVVAIVHGPSNGIVGCRVKSLSAALSRIGIKVYSEKVILLGNDVVITTGGGGTEFGIDLDMTGDHAIAIGNQTNGGGLNSAMAAPTIEHNRDDV